MKRYGLPRNDDVANPDCADIQLYGLKSVSSRVEKHGCVKNSFRNPVKKAAARRVWKKKARRKGKLECKL